MARHKKPTIEYQWEAYDPNTQHAVKRGGIRTDLAKVRKYAREIRDGITNLDTGTQLTSARTLAPYWRGLRVRIVTREVVPWEPLEEVELQEYTQRNQEAT